MSNESRKFKIAWFVYFPVEWLSDLPKSLHALPKWHPASWQRVLWEQLNTRNDLDLHVFVLRSQFPCSVVFQHGNTTFHCLKTPGGLRAASLFWLDTLLLRREFKRLQPDLIHAWGTENAAALIASRLPYPALVTMQGILTWIGQMTASSSKYFKLVRFLEPISLRRARMLTTESRFGANYLHDHYPHLGIHQIEHATARVFHEITREPQSKPLRVLTVCKLGYAKGGDLLLRALNSLMNEVPFELVVIGGEDRSMTDDLRKTLHPDLWKRIQFLNNLTAAEVADQMSKATLLVHPTRADTSPNSVKEAAVSGLPVIASNIGGIPDYIVHGRNGLLFPPGDLEALTGRIREAIQHPVFGAGKVDEAVHASVRAYLSPQRMGELFWNAYLQAMETGGDPVSIGSIHLQETPLAWSNSRHAGIH